MEGGSGLLGPVAAGLGIGMAVGVMLERSRYCTMGALTDLFLFGSWRRLRVWLVAAAMAIAGTSAFSLLGIVDLDRSPVVDAARAWPAMGVGGLLFGIGMVLAGGCASRSLVRFATGSMKSLVVLLLMAIFAISVTQGPLSRLASPLLHPGLPEWAGSHPLVMTTLGAVGAIALGIACISRQRVRGERAGMWLGIGLGAACLAGWLLTGPGFAGEAPRSLDFAAPTGFLLLSFIDGTLPPSPLLAGAAAGVLAGAAISAVASGSFAIETFSDRGDMLRHASGGVLMGIGGGLAFGCTVGQGITGLSTLAPGSFLAVAAMVAGCRLGLLHLEGRIRWPARSRNPAD